MATRLTPIVLAAATLLMSGGAQAAVVDIADNGGFETGNFDEALQKLQALVLTPM